jgi:hypothetical protein
MNSETQSGEIRRTFDHEVLASAVGTLIGVNWWLVLLWQLHFHLGCIERSPFHLDTHRLSDYYEYNAAWKAKNVAIFYVLL